MKKLAKKFLAAFLTAVIAVSGLAVTAVPAAAEGVFDGAVKINELEYQTKQFTEDSQNQIYKIVVPRNGTITIRTYECKLSLLTEWRLMDTSGKEIDRRGLWGDATYDIKNLKKGTYYFEVFNTNASNSIKFYYTFAPTEKPLISLNATLKKGDTLQLGTVTENYDGKVTWLSTKKTVATVSSKGLVTAKKAGTTYIRAQLDNGDYVEIKVVVKK